MDMTLTRYESRQDGIFGTMMSLDESFSCVTLEHAYGTNSHDWSPKIPPGNYRCVKGMHRLEHMTKDFETFEITGVVGHEGILFHSGNLNNDSNGCVLVGDAIVVGQSGGIQIISNSRETFENLMSLQSDTEEFLLTVI